MKVSDRWGRRILWAAAVAYVVFPIAFYSSVHLRQFFVFGHFFIWPFHEYRKPEMYGLPHAKNFYINSVSYLCTEELPHDSNSDCNSRTHRSTHTPFSPFRNGITAPENCDDP